MCTRRSPGGMPADRITALSRLVILLAVGGVAYGFASSPSLNYVTHNDLRPPIPRPSIAAALPSSATVSKILRTPVVLTENGLPTLGLFESNLPIDRDIRQNVLRGAWESVWTSANARTRVYLEVVARRYSGHSVHYTLSCAPTTTNSSSLARSVLRAGYVEKTATSAAYCAVGVRRRTEVFAAVVTSDRAIAGRTPYVVHALFLHVVSKVPKPIGRSTTSFSVPSSRAAINGGLLRAALGILILWTLPTLLFDRATWQRVVARLRLRRRREDNLQLAIDPAIRRRLLANTALGSMQLLAAVWVLRLSAAEGWGAVPTGGAVVASVLAVTALPRVVHLRSMPHSQQFRSWRRIMPAFGLLVALLVVAFGLAVLFLAVSVSVLGGTQVPDYVQERLALVVALLAIPTVLLANVPLMFLRRLAMRSMRSETLRDERSPILLLRSFADDDRRLRSRSSNRRSLVDRLALRRWERFEEVIAAALNTQGPVLAIGQVGERLPPPLGAVRRQLSDQEWQGKVIELMEQAAIVCVIVGRSQALVWEIVRIAKSGNLDKTVFILPPTSRREHRRRLAVLAGLLDLHWAEVDVVRRGSYAIALMQRESGGSPELVIADAQEDVAYDIALEHCMRALSGEAVPEARPVPQPERPSPRPPMEIYPAGKTPKHRPVLRRRRVQAVILLSIVSAGLAYLTGSGSNVKTVILPAGDSAIALTPGGGETSYVALNYHELYAFNGNEGTARAIVAFNGLSSAATSPGVLYLASAGNGEVEAYNLRSHRVLWRLDNLPGVRGLVLAQRSLTFLVPTEDEVRRVSERDGRTISVKRVAGVPWSDVLARSTLYVSLPDRADVVALDATTLRSMGKIVTSPEPDQLVAFDSRVWVYSVAARTLEPLLGRRRADSVIYLGAPVPIIAARSNVLAIGGVDEVTTMTASGPDLSNRRFLLSEVPDSVVVSRRGMVVASGPNALFAVRTGR